MSEKLRSSENRSRCIFQSVVIFFILFVSAQCFAQERIYFDIKTDINEKSRLLPVELGTIFIFSQSDWAGVLEIGEDYSLYLRDYRRKETNVSVYVSMEVELRKPGGWKPGEKINSQRLRLKIRRDDMNSSLSDLYNFIRSGFDLSSDEYHYEAIIVGKYVEKTAWNLYREIQESRTKV